jgi:putative ABC transport system permease protein
MLSIRALGWRKGFTLALVVVATLAVGSTAMAASYVSGAANLVFDQKLERAATYDTGISIGNARASGRWLILMPDNGEPVNAAMSAKAFLDQRDELAGHFEPAVAVISMGAVETQLSPASGPVELEVAWREGQCGKLPFVEGRCPVGIDEVTLPVDDANKAGIAIGDELNDIVPRRTLRVTGLYKVPDASDSHWFGRSYFQRLAPRPTRNGVTPPKIPAAFVSQPTADQFDSYNAGADRALRLGTVDRSSEELLLQAVQTTQGALAEEQLAGVEAAGWTLDTRLPAILREVRAEQDRLDRGGLIIGTQVMVIAWYVVYLLVASGTEQRQGEIALSKLRGHGLPVTLLFAAGQPALVLLLATPLGVALGVGVASLVGPALLPAGLQIELDLRTLLAVAVVVTGGIIASALALLHVVRDPVADQLRRMLPVRRGRAPVVVGAVICALALAGAYELRALGTAATDRSALALLAPVLVALSIALVGAQLFLFGARGWTRLTLRPRRLAGFLSSRQVARRNGSARLVVLLVTTLGLAIFAINSWQLGAEHRQSIARFEVAAPVRYEVQGLSLRELLPAVREADPSGRHAMAAALIEARRSDHLGRRVAVDSDRLAAVAEWDPAWSDTDLATIADRLRVEAPPPVTFTGRRLEIAVRADRLTTEAPLRLQAQLSTKRGKMVTAFFGRYQPGRATYRTNVPECTGGCRLDQLYLDRWLTPTHIRGALTIASVSSDDEVDAGLGTPGRWRPALTMEGSSEQGPAVSLEPRGGSGLRLSIDTKTATQRVAIAPRDVPAVVPVVSTGSPEVAANAAATAARAYEDRPVDTRALFFANGFDGQTRPLERVGHDELIPRLGRSGILLDLDYAVRDVVHPVEDVRLEVWMSGDRTATAGVAEALRQRGAVLEEPRTIADRRAELDTSDEALTMNLYLLAAVAGLVLAAAGATVLVIGQARRQKYEVAAAHAVGVDRKVLRRAAAGETMAGLVPAVVLALAAASLAGWLVLQSLPLSRSADLGPPTLEWTWEVLVGVCGTAAVALAAIAWLSAAIMVRTTDPDLLRRAPQ